MLSRRARKIEASRVKCISKFPSLKKGESVRCESLLECDFYHLAEIDPNVLYYCEQPLKVKYFDDGRERTYTPDAYLKRKDGDYIVEIKPAAKAALEKWQRKFALVAPILHDAGYKFVVATDTEIRREPRLTNVKILSRYWRIMFTIAHQAEARSFLRKGRQVTFNELAQFFERNGTPVQVAYALIYWGVLSIDIMKPLNENTIVTLADTS